MKMDNEVTVTLMGNEYKRLCDIELSYNLLKSKKTICQVRAFHVKDETFHMRIIGEAETVEAIKVAMDAKDMEFRKLNSKYEDLYQHKTELELELKKKGWF